MNVDLLFNVGDVFTPPISEGLAALDGPYAADWPLDALNEALKISYDCNQALPWIYVIVDGRGPVGYLVTPRDDRLTEADLEDAFWDILVDEGVAAERGRFVADLPAVCQGQLDGVTVGVVAHISRYGPPVPTEALGVAIAKIMGQADWLSSAVVWLYPVRKLDHAELSGIWVASKVDDLAENPQMDDLMFERIRDLNQVPDAYRLYPGFEPARFTDNSRSLP